MRLRTLAVVVLAASSLVACSGGGSNGSSASSSSSSSSSSASAGVSGAATGSAPSSGAAPISGSASAALCTNLSKVGDQVNSLIAKANDPTQLKQALDAAGSFLATLKSEAPPALAAPLANLTSLFNQAEAAFSNTTSPDLSKLAALATKAPVDLQKIQAYVQANCPAS